MISIKGIGRDGFLYKVIKSKEHSGFTELDNNPKRLFGPKPRNQFGRLSKNVVQSIFSKNKKKSLCDSYESLVDMIVINKLIKIIWLPNLKEMSLSKECCFRFNICINF